MSEHNESSAPRPRARLLTVEQFAQEHSWPPVGGLRWLIFHEKSNGFDQVVVRVGRRVLIDEDKFFTWARSGQQGVKR
jgi:hypothetical protein